MEKQSSHLHLGPVLPRTLALGDERIVLKIVRREPNVSGNHLREVSGLEISRGTLKEISDEHGIVRK